MSFFGIFIPSKSNGESIRTNDDIHVFSDRKEAFDMLKNHKEARLKVFKTNKDAEHFSQHGFEANVNINASTSESLPIPIPTTNLSLIPADKSPFRGPKSQDLVSFRKAIEQAKYDLVRETIWKNPRYLVGSGDTPTLLKESFRYNALHCAALAKNGKMCEILLQTISDPAFIELLHGKQDSGICEEVSSILLDLYLNMPEKGRNETPLHLAVKFGAVDVIEVLTSYPQCLAKPNSDGLFPKDLICFRITDPSKELVQQITNLLMERFYVPVIRSVDNSTPPIIGEPFSTTNPPNLVFDPLSPEMEVQAYAGPMNKEQAQTFRRRWKTPPRISTSSPNNSPGTSPSRHNSLYISPSQIRKFTPNKPTASMCSTPVSASRKGARQLFPNRSFDQSHQSNNNNMSLTLHNNALNSLNNDCANIESPENVITQQKLQQNDNKLFIDKENNDTNSNHVIEMPPPTVLLQKPEIFGMYRLMSDHFNDSGSSSIHNLSSGSMSDSPMYKERHLKLADPEKGLEVFGRQLAREQNVNWKEYWNFLGGFVDISSQNGLEKLEAHLKKNKSIRIGKLMELTSNDNDKSVSEHNLSVSSLCGALNKLNFRESRSLTNYRNEICVSSIDDLTQRTIPSSPNAFNAYLCAEKSCQVYAKRMTKFIVQNLSSIILINDSLKSELNRLKSLVLSYREDIRFYAVNFQSIHSRFADLIVAYLKYEHPETNLNDVHDVLNQIYQSTTKKSNGNENNGINGTTSTPTLTSSETQLDCLLIFLLHYLNHKENVIAPEIFTTERDCAEIWATEQKCECEWNTTELRNKNLIDNIKRKIKRKSFQKQQLQQAIKMNDWRAQSIIDSDEEYLSDSGSENDLYFTPPESPTQLIDSDDSFEDCDITFNNYILGEEPTKTDVDVINALVNTDIDEELYPHISEWKLAVLQHSVEERNNFPSPSVVVKSRKTSADHLPIKRLFTSPIKLPCSPVKKNTNFTNFLKPDFKSSEWIINNNNNSSDMGLSSLLCDKSSISQTESTNNSINLSCMQVSSIISPSKSDSNNEFKMKLFL